MAAPRKAIAVPVILAILATAAFALIAAWQWQLRAMDSRAEEYAASLKKLLLTQQLPPTDAVKSYLEDRHKALEAGFQKKLKQTTVRLPDSAASANPQLFFQERLHDVQREIERLVSARKMTVPEQLGFPKELPPSDTVPRLLAQLDLIEEASILLVEQKVANIISFKVEDPETVAVAEGVPAFLTRVPVRVRFSGKLPHLVKVLNALSRAQPLIDVRVIRVTTAPPPAAPAVQTTAGAAAVTTPASSPPSAALPAVAPTADTLDMEMVLVRYLADMKAAADTHDEDT